MPRGQTQPRREARLTTAVSLAIAIGALVVLGAVLMLGGDDSAQAPRTPAAPTRSAVYVSARSCDDKRSAETVHDAATPWCTLDRAIAAAPRGSQVMVAPGDYPVLKVAGDGSDRDLRLRPAGDRRPTLAGAQLTGVRGIGFTGFLFTGAVTIRESSDVTIADNGFASTTLYTRQSRRVTVAGNRFRDVTNGERALLAQGAIAPNQPTTEDLVIRDNLFDNIAHDAIAVYNGYRNVTVQGNHITHVWRPENADYHSDSMQFMGGDGLTIRDNVLNDNNQGILVKDGRESTHLVVEGNLITDGGAGLQLFNAPDARVAHNTIWGTRFGTIFDNDTSLPGRTSVALVDNVLDQLLVETDRDARVAEASGNVFGRGSLYGRPAYRGEPNFRDAARGDFRLAAGDPGAGVPAGPTTPGSRLRVP